MSPTRAGTLTCVVLVLLSLMSFCVLNAFAESFGSERWLRSYPFAEVVLKIRYLFFLLCLLWPIVMLGLHRIYRRKHREEFAVACLVLLAVVVAVFSVIVIVVSATMLNRPNTMW